MFETTLREKELDHQTVVEQAAQESYTRGASAAGTSVEGPALDGEATAFSQGFVAARNSNSPTGIDLLSPVARTAQSSRPLRGSPAALASCTLENGTPHLGGGRASASAASLGPPCVLGQPSSHASLGQPGVLGQPSSLAPASPPTGAWPPPADTRPTFVQQSVCASSSTSHAPPPPVPIPFAAPVPNVVVAPQLPRHERALAKSPGAIIGVPGQPGPRVALPLPGYGLLPEGPPPARSETGLPIVTLQDLSNHGVRPGSLCPYADLAAAPATTTMTATLTRQVPGVQTHHGSLPGTQAQGFQPTLTGGWPTGYAPPESGPPCWGTGHTIRQMTGTWTAFPVPASRVHLVRMAPAIPTASHRTELGCRKVRRHLLAD